MLTHTFPGKPTAYGFRCGYTEAIGTFQIEWEHCCYHIKGFNRNGVYCRQSATAIGIARKIARELNSN